MGHVEHAAGHPEAARDWFSRSIERFRVLEVPSGEGNALTGLAAVALAAGDLGDAERLLDQARTVLEGVGPWFLSPMTYVRANLAVRRGNHMEAIVLVRENLTRIRKLHDTFGFAY